MILPDQTGMLGLIANPVSRPQSNRPSLLQALLGQGTVPSIPQGQTGYQAFYGQTPFQAFQQGGFPQSGADWSFMQPGAAPAAAIKPKAMPGGLFGRGLTVPELLRRGLPSNLRGMTNKDIMRLRSTGTFR